jgi:Cys-Gly metallodipeptidase DUG1
VFQYFFLMLIFLRVCRAIYEGLDYTIADIEQAAGAPIALSANKVDVLMGRMRSPSLSLHGIEGAFSGAGGKTVIPAKVAGKFSIRCVFWGGFLYFLTLTSHSLVPPQTPELVDPLVIAYLEAEFGKLGSKNTLTVENLHGGKPWIADVNHWNFQAAKVATEVSAYAARFLLVDFFLWLPFFELYDYFRDMRLMMDCRQAVYQQKPDLTREGGSIPVTLTFAESLGVNVLLLPMGRGDDGAQCVLCSNLSWYHEADGMVYAARQMRNWTDRISYKG